MGDSDDEYDRRKSRDKFRRERDERDDNAKFQSSSSSSVSLTKRKESSQVKHDERHSHSTRDRQHKRIPNKRAVEDYEYSVPIMHNKRQRGAGWFDDDLPDSAVYNSYYQHDTREDFQNPHNEVKQRHSQPYQQPPIHAYPMQLPPSRPQFNNYQYSYQPPYNPHQHQYQQQQQQQQFTQPQMISFTQYLQTLNPQQQLTPEQATKRYNEYKNNFRKKQIEIFFDVHKNEEWFRSRYHPDEYPKRKREQREAIRTRLNVFMDLYNNNWLNIVDDSESGDGVVITDNQIHLLKFLDACMIRLEGGTNEDLDILNKIYSEENGKTNETAEVAVNVENCVKSNEKDDESGNNDKEKLNKTVSVDDSVSESSDRESGMCSESDEDNDVQKNVAVGVNSMKTNEKIIKNIEIIRIPQKPQSIFMKNLSVDVTRLDLEGVCKQFDGFKRVAVSEPAPDRLFQRRAWISFDSNVNISEICTKINELKVRNHNLSCGVNREIEQKIRKVNEIANHKAIVKNDIKLISKIIENMDKRWQLWQYENDNEVDGDGDEMQKTLKKLNPLLENINDYLIDEMSAEEEELLNGSTITSDDGLIKIDKDLKFCKKLDNLILYLRIVHSIDYYNANEYQQENWMPNRCGVIHVRNSVNESNNKIRKADIDVYIKQFEAIIKQFVEYKETIDLELAKRFGLKQECDEIQTYLNKNSIEVEKDKWLCKICKKKFKANDYVLKHIRVRHEDSLNDLKKMIEFFNNFVLDPKRPYLPATKSNEQYVSYSHMQPYPRHYLRPPQPQHYAYMQMRPPQPYYPQNFYKK